MFGTRITTVEMQFGSCGIIRHSARRPSRQWQHSYSIARRVTNPRHHSLSPLHRSIFSSSIVPRLSLFSWSSVSLFFPSPCHGQFSRAASFVWLFVLYLIDCSFCDSFWERRTTDPGWFQSFATVLKSLGLLEVGMLRWAFLYRMATKFVRLRCWGSALVHGGKGPQFTPILFRRLNCASEFFQKVNCAPLQLRELSSHRSFSESCCILRHRCRHVSIHGSSHEGGFHRLVGGKNTNVVGLWCHIQLQSRLVQTLEKHCSRDGRPRRQFDKPVKVIPPFFTSFK